MCPKAGAKFPKCIVRWQGRRQKAFGFRVCTADTQGSCSNEMHSTCAALYAFRLSLNQAASPALYRARSFDRGMATSAVFLATLGLSMSMFSLKQMQSSRQRRLRRLC
ncbi:uncharacterized protein LOC143895208 [Temnothorax americanus]|uniref:uncharacterized protein LOC143895208 n=1 Tax=Temnothorax americanus TaxID=1964332 RepID=UPI00406954C1